MIPNFTFRDPVFFSTASNGSEYISAIDAGAISAAFLIGRYGQASGWDEDTGFSLSFSTGSYTISIPFRGTYTEDVSAGVSFQTGSHTFALVSSGSFDDSTAQSSTFLLGTHFHCAVETSYGTESSTFGVTFYAGGHNEIALGVSGTDSGSIAVTFGTGSLHNELPETDPLQNKAIIRFSILPGELTGEIEYTGQGNPAGYTAEYLDGQYVITSATPESLTLDTAWEGTSFDDRYQLLFDAPEFPTPEGPAPGIVVYVDGTGTNVGGIYVDNAAGTGSHAGAPGMRDAVFSATFQNGSYSLILVSEDVPQDTVPNFCTFLGGTHSFVQQTGSITEDHSQVAATFSVGTHFELVVEEENQDSAQAAATFLNGAHEFVIVYPTADTTEITADSTDYTADNSTPE